MTSVLAYDSSWATEAGIPTWAICALAAFIVVLLVSWAISDLNQRK